MFLYLCQCVGVVCTAALLCQGVFYYWVWFGMAQWAVGMKMVLINGLEWDSATMRRDRQASYAGLWVQQTLPQLFAAGAIHASPCHM